MLGPGGSGISAVAAAGALGLADAHRPQRRGGPLAAVDAARTLLVTVDPRSTLPQRLGVFRVAGEPVAVTGELDLLHLDPLQVLEQAWTDFTAALDAAGVGRKLLPVVGTIAGVDAGELTGLPGAQEFLLLRAVRDAATSGRWQSVVVDLSGVGDPYALLRSPTVLAAAIDRLWPRNVRLAQASEKPALARVAAAVESIDRDCRDLRELLADPTGAAVHLVVPAGGRGQSTLPDHLALTEVMGLPLRSILVNAGPGALDTDAVAAQARTLLGGDADRAVPVGVVAAHDVEPVKLPQLRRLDVRLSAPDGHARGAAAPVVEHVGGGGLEARYRLRWRQTLPRPEELALGRSGDDLLVTVTGFRQPVPLPSVLRRCQVTGADFDGDELMVHFQPDPALWPQR